MTKYILYSNQGFSNNHPRRLEERLSWLVEKGYMTEEMSESKLAKIKKKPKK